MPTMDEALRVSCEHPGFYIKEELDARGWTQIDLAFVLKMLPQQLNPILTGKGNVSASMAVLFGDAFDMPAEFFSNLQKQYELSQVAPSDPSIRKRAVWQSAFPLREMISRGWIADADASLLDAQMLRFFEAKTMADVPFMSSEAVPVAHAAKKTEYTTTTGEQMAWLHRVRQVARTIEAPEYSRDKLLATTDRLSGLLSSPADAPSVAEHLRSCGVRFLVVESLPRAKIDGVCTWLDGQPVIAVTNRFDRFDNFWFVVRHEIEHVLCGHGREDGASTIDDDTTLGVDATNEEEKIANAAASNFCIPKKQMDSFLARKGTFASEADVIGFAKRLSVHPSIVVGQYQFITKKWNFLRKYLSSTVCGVRKALLSELENGNHVDGWGVVARAEL
jgi:HTH-type transcriptional regulator / antitoxin HigA